MTLSKIRNRKRKIVVLHLITSSITRVIRKFQVIVVQGRQRNGQQKSAVMPVQSCCFANLNLLLFCRSRCPRRRRGCLRSLIIR